MRARHRHFNPKDAGAVAAYDTRFITGLNDGDNVATWSSRTGTNDATQATVGNQPNYETNEINGNPVVNFTPANADQFVISISVPASWTEVAVLRRATNAINSILFGNSSVGRYSFWWFTDNVIYSNPSNTVTFSPAQTTTGPHIVSTTKNSTSQMRAYLNSVAFSAAQSSPASSGSFNRIGAVTTNYNNGAIGNLCLLDSFVSNSLRRRLEHASAFSFKISCN